MLHFQGGAVNRAEEALIFEIYKHVFKILISRKVLPIRLTQEEETCKQGFLKKAESMSSRISKNKFIESYITELKADNDKNSKEEVSPEELEKAVPRSAEIPINSKRWDVFYSEKIRVSPRVNTKRKESKMLPVVKDILYRHQEHCTWSKLPVFSSSVGKVCYYFYQWKREGLLSELYKLPKTFTEVACEGEVETLKLLIGKGVNIYGSAKNIGLPLISALDNKHIKIIRLLVDHGGFIYQKYDQLDKQVLQQIDLEGRVCICLTIAEKPVTRKTPGFEDAITSRAELIDCKAAIKDKELLIRGCHDLLSLLPASAPQKAEVSFIRNCITHLSVGSTRPALFTSTAQLVESEAQEEEETMSFGH